MDPPRRRVVRERLERHFSRMARPDERNQAESLERKLGFMLRREFLRWNGAGYSLTPLGKVRIFSERNIPSSDKLGAVKRKELTNAIIGLTIDSIRFQNSLLDRTALAKRVNHATVSDFIQKQGENVQQYAQSMSREAREVDHSSKEYFDMESVADRYFRMAEFLNSVAASIRKKGLHIEERGQ